MKSNYLQEERNLIFSGKIVLNNLQTVVDAEHILGIDENGFIVKTQSGGSGGGAVDSVNGQTGTVILDAEDVNAATAQDIADAISALNLGTASTQDTSAFSTAAQGAKADTAVQPADLNNYVPTNRTINAKALTANISLTNVDVGAAATSHTHDTAAIISGTFDAARIPTLDQSKINNLVSDLAGKQATLSVPSQSEAETGTATTARSWTAQRGKQSVIGASRSIIPVSGNKTLALTDEYTYQRVTAASIITIPTNTTVAIPIGAEIDFFQSGSGIITFAAAGGVTVNSYGDTLVTDGKGAAATLKKVGTNEWDLTI